MNVSIIHNTTAEQPKTGFVCVVVRPKHSEKLIFRPRRPFMPRF